MRVSPITSDLALVADRKGKLRLEHKGVLLPGVLRVEVEQDSGGTSEVRVLFSGAAVRFETETA